MTTLTKVADATEVLTISLTLTIDLIISATGILTSAENQKNVALELNAKSHVFVQKPTVAIHIQKHGATKKIMAETLFVA